MDDDELISFIGDEFPRPLRAIIARIPEPWIPEITIEQGWWPLLVRLDSRLAFVDPGYRIRRIAPESGRLCFELAASYAPVVLSALIQAAVEESERTCEVCGQPGARREPVDLMYWVLCAEDGGDDEDTQLGKSGRRDDG